LKKNKASKLNDYFPNKIISNKKIKLNLNNIKLIILNDKDFYLFIKKANNIKDIMYVYNEYFVYYKNNQLIKIKKYDFFKISSIWRSYQYSINKKGIMNL